MKATVLLSSGDEDTWTDVIVEFSPETGGGLIVKNDPGGETSAWYAPGMWMRVEFDQ